MQNKEDFWNDQNSALKIVGELSDLKSTVFAYKKISNTLKDVIAFFDDPTDGDELYDLLDKELLQLESDVEEFRKEVLFVGEYDSLPATLEIHPGAGGTESHDRASMLYRLYQRFCEKHNFKITLIDYLDGEEAGIKSVTLQIKGKNAYGMLKSEKGVHRLVRISPFDSNSRRHTSFASVNVTPVFGDNVDIKINESDLKIDTFRSSGAGGQNVNKVESAVRITHLPTGIVVSCQIERSQLINKETCMSMLKAKLYEKELEEKRAKLKSIVGQQKLIEWGSQIRSYVFCPYTMVKDHRTGVETPDVQGVMDGDIERFIYAYLEEEVKVNEAIS